MSGSTIEQRRRQLQAAWPNMVSPPRAAPTVTIGATLGPVRVEVFDEESPRHWRWIHLSVDEFHGPQAEAVLTAPEARVLIEVLTAAVDAAEAALGGVSDSPIYRTTEDLNGRIATHRLRTPGGRWSAIRLPWVREIPLTGYAGTQVEL